VRQVIRSRDDAESLGPWAQINGCGWCIDLHTKEAAAAGETAVRLSLVAAWRHATAFTRDHPIRAGRGYCGTSAPRDEGELARLTHQPPGAVPHLAVLF
jgi:AhpD family alkylhydroperoxidase